MVFQGCQRVAAKAALPAVEGLPADAKVPAGQAYVFAMAVVPVKPDEPEPCRSGKIGR
jgi:hypothetical protein